MGCHELIIITQFILRFWVFGMHYMFYDRRIYSRGISICPLVESLLVGIKLERPFVHCVTCVSHGFKLLLCILCHTGELHDEKKGCYCLPSYFLCALSVD